MNATKNNSLCSSSKSVTCISKLRYHKNNLAILFLIILGHIVNGSPIEVEKTENGRGKSRQLGAEDDAVIVDAGGGGGGLADIITDGPGPSIIGSVDNVFDSIKEFDQNECIQKMLCEYMQEEGNTVSALLQEPLQAFRPPPSGPSASTGFGAESFISSLIGGGGASQDVQPQTSPTRFGPQTQQQFQNGFVPPQGGFVAPQQQQFQQQQQPQQLTFQQQQLALQQQFGGLGPPPVNNIRPQFQPQQQQVSPSPQGGGILDTISNFILGSRRRRNGFSRRRRVKRQSTQGNIIRLFQATGMSSHSFFPYLRAALIGHATRTENQGFNTLRRRGSCAQMYRKCPSEEDRVLDILNNHNGGVFNTVGSSVQNEVGPIVSAIISDAIGGESSGSSTNQAVQSGASNILGGLQTAASTAEQSGDGFFGTIDSLLSQTLINGAVNYLTGGSSNGGSSGGGPPVSAVTSETEGSAAGGALSFISSLLGNSDSGGSGDSSASGILSGITNLLG